MLVFIYKATFFKKQKHFPMKSRKSGLGLHIACRSFNTAVKINSFFKTASR